MSDTIKRATCPECGPRIWADERKAGHCEACGSILAERTYVAVDALLSDAVQEAASSGRRIREVPRDYLRAAIAAVTGEQP